MIKVTWIVLLLTNLFLIPLITRAQPGGDHSVYQYAANVGTRTAYLWIPPSCKYVRGIVIAAENALERNWMESGIVRKAAADEGLAMIWLADGKGSPITYEITTQAATLLDTMFRDLASISGYHEIEFAPLIFTGHSWNGRMAWNYPAQRPDRVIAAVPIRTYPMPDSLSFTGIPLLYIVGQTTELPQYGNGRAGDRDFFWPIVRQTALALRSKNENNLIGVAVNPGGCHMDWTDNQSVFLALFIHKACKYRLPADKPVNGKVVLKNVDRSQGWLTDTGCLNPDHFKPAAYAQYKGDPKKAFWFFDKEMAMAAIAFNGDKIARRKQMTTVIQNDMLLPVQRNGSVGVKWLPANQTATFKLEAGFLDAVPAGLLDSGMVIGHSTSPPQLYAVMGPVKQIDDHSFQLAFDRQAPRTIAIMTDHPGDQQYRRATQPGSLNIPSVLKEGREQHIQFPAIKDQSADNLYIPLHAKTDSGLPVGYYVRAGPAVIRGDSLVLTGIPVNSRYPIKVTVVAYQWGQTIEPLYRSAEPVSINFFIYKNGLGKIE